MSIVSLLVDSIVYHLYRTDMSDFCVCSTSCFSFQEIPTGLYLLRQIRKKDFNKKLMDKNYKKFVFAAILRILLG